MLCETAVARYIELSMFEQKRADSNEFLSFQSQEKAPPTPLAAHLCVQVAHRQSGGTGVPVDR